MNRRASNLEVKKLNRNTVFRYMNECEQNSMSEIASALAISGPTVLSIINELKDTGLVQEVGEFESTGGRKAKAFGTIKDAAYAIGVDITRHHVGITYTNLSREMLGEYERTRKNFEDTEVFFAEVADMIREFVVKHQIPEERIVGMGLSVAGIVDRERNLISRSHVLDVKDVSLDKWLCHMPYPCEVLNDANAAAIAECHDMEKEGGMIYLSLSNSVGGAIVFDANLKRAISDTLYVGDNWRSGEFGHMVIQPGGKTCYCGKKGCLDAYCSAYNLADMEEGKLERFFEKLEQGSEAHEEAWNQYLEYLAIAVDNLKVCFDCDIILGGYVGGFMEPYLGRLKSFVSQNDIFEKEGKYVKAGRYKKEASAIGAAIFQIDRYIAEI